MAPGPRRFFRDNTFLVAAVALPLLVVVFFILATAIPRWLVAPPAYDLLIRANDVYNQSNPRVSVDYAVRGGKVTVVVRRMPAGVYAVRSRLFLFDHTAMRVREIPIDLPEADQVPEASPWTTTLDALGGRRVIEQTQAPDGYRFENRSERGPGLVGDLFGMNAYGSEGALVKKGRVIPLSLPIAFQNVYAPPVYAVGWLEPESASGTD